ncbi:MAG: hypothetical protein FWF15_02740, partial [Oscillospiraceae bacterium]|nr:hypothetical protein [Oscillospiraceae bacterium]
MILKIDGEINQYYAQTLCMIFFPGEDFSEKQTVTDDTPVVTITIDKDLLGVNAKVHIKNGGESAEAKNYILYNSEYTEEKVVKFAAGTAMLKAGKSLFGCVPPWGILTGVRPSKIAADLLHKGNGINEIKSILTKEYYLNPKKASLVTNIAVREDKIIKSLPKNSCSLY